MRRLTLSVILCVLFTFCLAFGEAKKSGRAIIKSLPLDYAPGIVLKNRTNSQYLPDRVIVKLMPQTLTSLSKGAFGIPSIDRVLSYASVTSAKQMFPFQSSPPKTGQVDLSLVYVVTFSSPNDPFTVAEQLSKLPDVQYAEPWFIYPVAHTSFPPNDSLYLDQWNLQKINAPAAWDITAGDSTVVIAIVDSGVDWHHPDLAANIWTNPGETPGNGIDDDHNGYPDDVHGWDLVGARWESPQGDNDPAPTADNNNHGTHVAGIAAAVTDNGIGVASVAFKCRILPVKCSADDDVRASGEGYIIAGDEGIVYAADMGAKVINCSWGGEGGSQFEQDIIDYATEQGALVVAAAGNSGSDAFFSPAGYQGVLGVAATDQSDRKSFYSNFGDFVDVCAPGDGIVSTILPTSTYPTGYAYLSGTSMATPLAAGVAALVRSQHPELSPLQAGEQVRVGCDDISAHNLTYFGQLGHGRINALRALTNTTIPSVRLQSFAVTDPPPGGNGNGIAQPGETLNVTCVVRNYLAPTSLSATITLTSLSAYLTVPQGAFAVPSLGTLDSASNALSPFLVQVDTTVPPSQTAKLQLTFTDGSYSDIETISILVNPTYATHDINDIELTLTNNGRLGFYDFPDNTQGVGFIFHGVNDLYEGGLIIGTSDTTIVDVVRNDSPLGEQDQDFVSNNFYTLTTPGLVSQQDGWTTFTDSGAAPANQIGLQVSMYSYAYSDLVNSKYLLLRYDIKNKGAIQLTNLYAGIFLDWDLGDFSGDVSRYDATRSLGYCFDSSRQDNAYVGIRALDSAASFRSLVNDMNIDLSRAGKWSWISAGFGQTSAGPADIHHVISSGPYTINPGDSVIVGFALVVGDSSLANIQQNADAAKSKWIALRGGKFSPPPPPAPPPVTFALEQNYPNPFNLTTNLQFQTADEEFVSLKVFDLLGREVATLVDEERSAGSYKVSWDASRFPSGVYFYRLQAGPFIETKKMVLLK
jgi:serine protease